MKKDKTKQKMIKEMIKFYKSRMDNTSVEIQTTMEQAKKLANKLFKINRRGKTLSIENEKEILNFYNFILEAELKPRRNTYTYYRMKIKELREKHGLI